MSEGSCRMAIQSAFPGLCSTSASQPLQHTSLHAFCHRPGPAAHSHLSLARTVKDISGLHTNPSHCAAILSLTVADDGKGRPDCAEWQACQRQPGCVNLQDEACSQASLAASIVKPGDWIFTIDMKSGYHHIPLKQSFRKYCCFQLQGRVYRWRVLPFGLSSAPRAYTKLTRVLFKSWGRQRIRCTNCIDDFLFAAATLAEAPQLRARLLDGLVRYGWYISFSKSFLQPGQ